MEIVVLGHKWVFIVAGEKKELKKKKFYPRSGAGMLTRSITVAG